MTDLDHVAAETGVLAVQDNIADPTGIGSSALLAMREKPELSLTGENWQRFRACSNSRVRFDVSSCNTIYDPAIHGEKCSDTSWSNVTFKPFSFHELQEVECVGSGLDLQAETDMQIRRDSEWALTTELDRSPATGNPSLRSVGLDFTPAQAGVYRPVSVLQALSMLHTIYRQSASGFVVAAPQEVVLAMSERNLIRERSGLFQTVSRMPVFTGSGLSGVAPAYDRLGAVKATPPDPLAPFSGVFSIYAMRSMPEYRLGEVFSYHDVTQSSGPELTPRTNSVAAESLRRGVVRFDPFCVYSIQVCLRDESFCS